LLLAALAACAGSRGAADLLLADTVQVPEASADGADVPVGLPTCPVPAAAPDPVALGLGPRAPVDHHVDCTADPGFESLGTDAPDVNWVCTFDHAGTFGVLYLPAEPVNCHWDLMVAVDYATPAASMVACGQVLALANPRYDWGGNHHSDFLEFDLAGRHYKLFHSSFDTRWRQCHPIDCLQVYDAGGDTLLEDGCTAERTLPIVCVTVADDGTVPPLVDTFEPCSQ